MEILKEYNLNWETTIYESKDIILNKKVGSGASGTVYQGKLKDIDVVYKCLYAKDYEDDLIDLLDDINSELMIYTKLKNTNYCCELVGISWSEKDNTFYVILKDYNVNGDMNDYINESKYWTKYWTKEYTKSEKEKNFYIYEYKNKTWIYHMPKNIKIEMTLSLCEAIKELHSKNIVHCDLKTNNLLYSENDKKIIIIDYGASHFMNKEKYERINQDWGTVGYTCETLNKGICHKKCDIYSLAVCILEIWVGGIWDGSETHKGSRKEVLRALRLLEKKGDLEKNLVKVLRGALNPVLDQRPYIETFAKKINKVF